MLATREEMYSFALLFFELPDSYAQLHTLQRTLRWTAIPGDSILGDDGGLSQQGLQLLSLILCRTVLWQEGQKNRAGSLGKIGPKLVSKCPILVIMGVNMWGCPFDGNLHASFV